LAKFLNHTNCGGWTTLGVWLTTWTPLTERLLDGLLRLDYTLLTTLTGTYTTLWTAPPWYAPFIGPLVLNSTWHIPITHHLTQPSNQGVFSSRAAGRSNKHSWSAGSLSQHHPFFQHPSNQGQHTFPQQFGHLHTFGNHPFFLSSTQQHPHGGQVCLSIFQGLIIIASFSPKALSSFRAIPKHSYIGFSSIVHP